MPDDPDVTIHRFSQDVFRVARDFAQGKRAADEAQRRMNEFREQFPAMATLAESASDDLQEDLKGVLSEASLDLSYVDSEGALPTSRRLGRLLREQPGSE